MLQPDVIHLGGIVRLLEAAAFAEAFGLPIAPHNASGPIGTAATLHAVAAIPNLFLQEMFAPDDAPWKGEIAFPAHRIFDGRIDVPRGPGLGIEINVDELARHPFVERDLDFYDSRSILEHAVSRQPQDQAKGEHVDG